jgi:hypothetical protein
MTPAQIAEAQKLAREWKPKPHTSLIPLPALPFGLAVKAAPVWHMLRAPD